MHGSGGGQHVAGVREGREGRHVAGQGGRAEGAALVHQALGEVVHAVLGLFALLGLAGHLPVPGLDAFLLHGQRSVDLLSKGDRKDGRLVFCHNTFIVLTCKIEILKDGLNIQTILVMAPFTLS